MNIVVQGTKEFVDYNIFMRAMGVALSSIKDDKEFNVYSVGPAQVNSFTSAFCNISEEGLKNRGIKVKFHKVPASYVENNITSFNYFAFLSTPGQRPSKLSAIAELAGVEIGVFRY